MGNLPRLVHLHRFGLSASLRTILLRPPLSLPSTPRYSFILSLYEPTVTSSRRAPPVSQNYEQELLRTSNRLLLLSGQIKPGRIMRIGMQDNDITRSGITVQRIHYSLEVY